jgi:hypothetical protein
MYLTPYLSLNFQVLAVCFRNVLRRRSAHIVAVHEDRHAPIPFFHALRSRSDVLVDAEQVLRVKFGFDVGKPFGVTQVALPTPSLSSSGMKFTYVPPDANGAQASKREERNSR